MLVLHGNYELRLIVVLVQLFLLFTLFHSLLDDFLVQYIIDD